MIRIVRDIKGSTGFVQTQRSICRNVIQYSETVSAKILEMLLPQTEPFRESVFLHEVYHVAHLSI